MGVVPADLVAVGSPWLRPSMAGLYALTAEPPQPQRILTDPGLVLHILRYSRPTPDPDSFAFSDAILLQPALCETAVAALEIPGGTGPDWQATAGKDVIRTGLRIAQVAQKLARETALCSPASAWAAGLLAPLGQYTAVSHELPVTAGSTLARRAAVRWRIPTSFAMTVGFLEFATDDAVRLGAHRGLFRVVRAAASAIAPDFAGGFPAREDAELLAKAIAIGNAEAPPPLETPTDSPEIPTPVLVRLLRTTARARHKTATLLVCELERQVDRLAESLLELRSHFDTAVRDAKLSAMAEFAAGASHEINNPLAVISGNAQLLQAGETDPDRQKRCSAIVRGTRRIHDILLGTRQFARPQPARPSLISLARWLTDAVESHQPEALEKGVSVAFAGAEESHLVTVDPAHIRDALAHLIRNAIEASPRGGKVLVRVEDRGSLAAILVEDAGPGPRPGDIEHLFDPFFSGRDAGRGRGLGLSIAWKLATINGGTVTFEPTGTGTRFVLTLPRAGTAGIRLSA